MQRLPALRLSRLGCSTTARRLLAAALALPALASSGGAAAAGTGPPPWPSGALSASGSPQISGLVGSSSSYDVSLTYTVTDDGAGVVHDIALSGQLTNISTGDGDAFACVPQHVHPWLPEPGPAGLLWLVPNASVSCSASLTLPPGDYTAALTATGRVGGIWYFPLVFGYLPPWQDDFSGDRPACRVLAQAQIPLDLAAPPPPTPSSAPPPPRLAPMAVPSTPPVRLAAVTTPPPPPPSSPPPSTSPASPPPPAPSASAGLLYVAPVAAAQPPAAPQIPTPLFVLIMVLPAVAAGAALFGRGR